MAVLFLASGVTACGDADDDPPDHPVNTVSPASPGPGTGGVDPQPSDSASASGPADTTAAKREVVENWTRFFDPALSTDEKAKVLENGAVLTPLLTAFRNDKRGGRGSAEVKQVRFNSATQAEVTYDLLLDGAPVLPGSKGTAVLQDNLWKVSVRSLCALVEPSGDAAAPGC